MCRRSSQGDALRSKGEEVQLHAPLDKINLHLREGSVLTTQVNMIFGGGRYCDIIEFLFSEFVSQTCQERKVYAPVLKQENVQ